MRLDEIQIRDPFVVPVESLGKYYLFGTTDKDCWGAGTGFDCYWSPDLVQWHGPIAAFRPPAGFWATKNFWAPECHQYRGRFYIFASFKASRRYRGTQVLVSDTVEGPYVPLSDGPVTPRDWECLDGTLHVDDTGVPWIVFCHEWVQVSNGTVCALQLSEDLRTAVGAPKLLFSATDAPWIPRAEFPGDGLRDFPTYVTDGPFLHRTKSGALLMIWSSFGTKGYAIAVARSRSGHVTGPWDQVPEPLYAEDGGHGMVFRDFGGRLMLSLHSPNNTPMERPLFVPISETADGLRLA